MDIQVLKKGELPDLPEGLAPFKEAGIIFPYGIKIIYRDGKPTWQAASREDMVASEAKRPGASEVPDVFVPDSCGLVSPTQCSGSCAWEGGFCARYYDPAGRYYYCRCGG